LVVVSSAEVSGNPSQRLWILQDSDGFVWQATAPSSALTFLPAESDAGRSLLFAGKRMRVQMTSSLSSLPLTRAGSTPSDRPPPPIGASLVVISSAEALGTAGQRQ